jgi:parallel beta-helix repeat protein
VGSDAGATTICTYVAAQTGSDSNPGTVAAPFQTAQKLVATLQAGQTGCLRAGTYSENVTFRRGGTASAPITLTSYPGESATVVGRMYVAQGADYATVTGVHLDGVNATALPSPTIDANHVTFSYDDVTDDHTGICFGVGNATWGTATGTLITHDRIHDCGRLPATNYEHGIYVTEATDTTIEWNLIYDNADRGIQLYPDAQYTTIDHNIIDGNGEGILFAGEGGTASSYTDVYDNIVSNATVRHDVESYWPAGNPLGVGNTVHDNCVWGGRQGTIDTSGGGFSAAGNLVVDPGIVDAATHDYGISAGSPCLILVGDVQAAVDRTPAVVPSDPTTADPSGGTTARTSPAGDPTSGDPAPPGAAATTTSAGSPVALTAQTTQPVESAKPKQNTRKVVAHHGPKKRKRKKRPSHDRHYPSLRRLP